jgi:Flp pilus assembly protein TadD
MTIRPFRSCLAALCLVLGAAAAHAQSGALADLRAEVQRMWDAGEREQALSRLDAALAEQPADAQLRFMKGVLLAEAGRTGPAIDIYTRLTQDYPELPEPHNNLAVLFAVQGRLDEARDALRAALRDDPNYSTAQQNLGDIYLRLAQRAYEHVATPTPLVQRKLELVRAAVLEGAAPPRPRPVSQATNTTR